MNRTLTPARTTPSPSVGPASTPRLHVPVRIVGAIHWTQPVLAALATMTVEDARRGLHRNNNSIIVNQSERPFD